MMVVAYYKILFATGIMIVQMGKMKRIVRTRNRKVQQLWKWKMEQITRVTLTIHSIALLIRRFALTKNKFATELNIVKMEWMSKIVITTIIIIQQIILITKIPVKPWTRHTIALKIFAFKLKSNKFAMVLRIVQMDEMKKTATFHQVLHPELDINGGKGGKMWKLKQKHQIMLTLTHPISALS